MNTEERDKLASLVTQRLIDALEDKPSAAMIDRAITWLTRTDAGAIKPSKEEEQQKAAERTKTTGPLPFPPRSADGATSLAGLPFVKEGSRQPPRQS